jgi:N-acetylneuraminic acid mutarotase
LFSAAAVVFAVNAGGKGYVDADGETYLSDRGFEGAVAGKAARPTHGTSDPALYETYRAGAKFIFSEKVPNGTYTLELSFYDPQNSSSGQRLFNVVAEDRTILRKFDIIARAGNKGAITRVTTVIVNDGRLSLGFTGVKGSAIVSAIELRRGKSDTTWQWIDPATAPMARYEAAGAVVNNRLYVFGGYRNQQIQATARSDVYDPTTDKWSRIADMPEPLTHAGQAVYGNTIWLVGGFVGDNPGPGTAHVWRYYPRTNTWKRGPNLPAARGAGAAAIIGHQLHFFGGLDHANSSKKPVKVDYADHWVLDLAKGGGWKRAAPLPNPRNHLSGVSLSGFVYAIGGQHLWNEDHPLSEVDRYDPTTNRWKAVASLPKPRSHMSASTFVINNRIMVIGGATNGLTSISDVDTYNPAMNKWLHFSNLPSPRLTPVAGFADGTIIAATGSQFNLQADAEAFAAITVD